MSGDTWTCTDCAEEIPADERREHMRTAHGVTYTLPALECPICHTHPCKRMSELEPPA